MAAVENPLCIVTVYLFSDLRFTTSLGDPCIDFNTHQQKLYPSLQAETLSVGQRAGTNAHSHNQSARPGQNSVTDGGHVARSIRKWLVALFTAANPNFDMKCCDRVSRS